MQLEALLTRRLMDRGMPQHVAQGFVMNFQDESGLRTDINEIEPVVPGSRGGYGLAQWTGPRRVALERFAEGRGKDPSDMETQLDFLMTELRGPESRAAKAIYATDTPGEAATAVMNQFLRPAQKHRGARQARYEGAAPANPLRAAPQPANRLMGLLPEWKSTRLDPREFMFNVS